MCEERLLVIWHQCRCVCPHARVRGHKAPVIRGLLALGLAWLAVTERAHIHVCVDHGLWHRRACVLLRHYLRAQVSSMVQAALRVQARRGPAGLTHSHKSVRRAGAVTRPLQLILCLTAYPLEMPKADLDCVKLLSVARVLLVPRGGHDCL